ncbi:MAG: hypothetical protein WCI18_03125 [Pseudomonadota bacterium]
MKKNLRKLSVLLLLSACGSQSSVFNLFPQKLDPADRAAKYLEEGQPEKAKSLMLNELGPDFSNTYNALDAASITGASDALAPFVTTAKQATFASLLASAEAQASGLDPIELMLKSKSLSDSSGQSSNIFIAMWPILPAANAASVLSAQKATAALVAMSSFYIREDTLKLTLFQLAATSLSLKVADTNGNNILDASEIASLDLATATLILSQIVSAAQAAASITAQSETNEAKVASKISSVATALSQSSGSDDQQKVQSWLGTLGN